MNPPPKTTNDGRSPAMSEAGDHPVLSRVSAGLTSIWRCPRCRGALARSKETLDCRTCGHRYGQVDGIPDLRIPGESWIDFEEDLAIAREVAALDLPLEGLVRAVYARRSGWD